MINSKSKKNVLVIRGSRTLGDPLLLFGEEMKIFSSNFDGDGDIRKISGMGTGRLVPSPPLPIAIPSPSCHSNFFLLFVCGNRKENDVCPESNPKNNLNGVVLIFFSFGILQNVVVSDDILRRIKSLPLRFCFFVSPAKATEQQREDIPTWSCSV